MLGIRSGTSGEAVTVLSCSAISPSGWLLKCPSNKKEMESGSHLSSCLTSAQQGQRAEMLGELSTGPGSRASCHCSDLWEGTEVSGGDCQVFTHYLSVNYFFVFTLHPTVLLECGFVVGCV